MANRLLVTSDESHITEQRRIEDEIELSEATMDMLTTELGELLDDREWEQAGRIANRIEKGTDYIQLLEYRLEDVIDINAQLARIQGQVDRIEKQLKETNQ
jgi:hypothetical protein